MNTYIRKVAFVILGLLGVVMGNLIWIQLINAQDLASRDENQRGLLREYSIQRGPILSADGLTIAESIPTPTENLRYLRSYPQPGLFSHQTGFYSFIFGREGIESSRNLDLTGQGGVLSMQDITDSLLRGGRRGDTVFLTIDSRVQDAAVSALGELRGAAVALDPVSGQIIAMASNPAYDPNLVSSHDAAQIRSTWAALEADPNKPRLNRATLSSYPPGSIFKLVTAAAALDHGFGPETSFPDARQYQPEQTTRTIGNFGGSRCGGDMQEALRVSCNTYFAELGATMQGADLEDTASAFGFGEEPPFGAGDRPDLRVAASKIPSSSDLESPAFRALTSIGQFDVSATPFQMALVVAAIARGGDLPVPQLVLRVVDTRGTVIEQSLPKTWRTAISTTTANTIKDMMVKVVEEGTGRNARISGIEVGGKTGTAQAGQEGADPHAWFVAFAGNPTPKIAVAVVVENGGDLGSEATGGRLAAPVAKAIIEAHREVAGW